MLVISRKVDQTIEIGDEIKITIVDISGSYVKIGIDAPKTVKIWRNDSEDQNANPNN